MVCVKSYVSTDVKPIRNRIQREKKKEKFSQPRLIPVEKIHTDCTLFPKKPPCSIVLGYLFEDIGSTIFILN